MSDQPRHGKVQGSYQEAYTGICWVAMALMGHCPPSRIALHGRRQRRDRVCKLFVQVWEGA
jgi:hypothetical protein